MRVHIAQFVFTGKILLCYILNLRQSTINFAKPQIEKTDWETLELSMTDPFSNRLIFWEDA